MGETPVLEYPKFLEGVSTAVAEAFKPTKTALDEAIAIAKARFTEPKPELVKTATETAEMSEGFLAGITKMQVWDIPVGQALVGGFIAVVVSELIDGCLVKQGTMVQGLVKLGAAGATVKWGRGLLGTTGAAAVALLLAYDGVRMILPIDEYASKLTGQVTKLTGGGLGGRAGMGGGVVQQAQQVAGDYYARAFGR